MLIALLLGERPKYAFRYGLLAGVACMGTGFHWLPFYVTENLQVSLATGCLSTLLAMTWDAFRFGLFGYVAAVIRPASATAALVWPTVWVALEWLWPHVFPWRLGHSQSAWIEAVQISELFGVYGVSFLMVGSATAAAMLLRTGLAWRAEGATPMRPVLWQAGVSALVVFCALAWGRRRIEQIEDGLATRPQLTVALVQPGTTSGRMLETCRAKSQDVQAQAELICWPESSIGDYSLMLTSLRPSNEVAATQGTAFGVRTSPEITRPLLCGGGSFAPGAPDGPYFNTAFLIDAEANILGRYHKRGLAPWGEYVAGQQWIPGLRELFGIRAEYLAGDSAAPLNLPDGAALGVLICYEDLLEDHARESVRAGAHMLVNLNNLAAFGRSHALWQHQQLAQFRAVETRRYLLRCGTVGSTAVISATGRVVAQAPPHEAAALVQAIPLLETQTLYTRFGDVLAIMCMVTTAVLAIKKSSSRPLFGASAVWTVATDCGPHNRPAQDRPPEERP